MDTVYIFLQHYWWFIVSLLGALLVFLLFVQGGQGMLYVIGRSDSERNLIVNSLGRKWELTFTTLVTFGGAFFASFPLLPSVNTGLCSQKNNVLTRSSPEAFARNKASKASVCTFNASG